MRVIKTIIGLLVIVILVAGLYIGGAWLGLYGVHEGPGTPTAARVPEAVVEARTRAELNAAKALTTTQPKQILFGDLHVHSTFSTDAFLWSLPMMQGEGAHPISDACDYARFCSGLDFWSITDHAEASTPRRWKETREAIRECQAVSGEGADPDVAVFIGWEWSQVGATPADHYGHKNVIMKGLKDDEIPPRPIGAGGLATDGLRGSIGRMSPLTGLLDFPNRQRYYDFVDFMKEVRDVPLCPQGVNSRDLPKDCYEYASTPHELFQKLDQEGFESIVIPHGNTWGFYSPPGITWDKQLTKEMNDPKRQFLIEVMSGHGNSEQYRDWKEISFEKTGQTVCPPPTADHVEACWRVGEMVEHTCRDGGIDPAECARRAGAARKAVLDYGSPVCPQPTKNYLPSCWRAGEIIAERCRAAGIDAAECEKRAAEARQNYITAGIIGHLSVPGATAADWLDSGQCKDCFLPSFNYRPGGSTQYALAISNFDDPANPLRFHFGFLASSDNHRARPGTGYKEFGRLGETEAAGPASPEWRRRMMRNKEAPEPRSHVVDINAAGMRGFGALETERQGSFFLTGGLVAVHANGRSRDEVWNALKRREVYGTSGDHILLWFNLLNAPGPNGSPQSVPMGGEVRMNGTPRFEVRAVGAFKQKPGCPDYAVSAMTPQRIQYVCQGECYNPSDERKRITRIEVVRIRPQITPGEPVAKLIEDPWRTFQCEPSTAGCVVQFEDPDFVPAARTTTYYVRAIEEPSPAVNAGNLRCKYDESGQCLEVRPCYADYRTARTDDCLATIEERAWSSPIYLDLS
jgi:hypothetical protein